jgi:hypothetical protein
MKLSFAHQRGAVDCAGGFDATCGSRPLPLFAPLVVQTVWFGEDGLDVVLWLSPGEGST